MVSLKAAKGGSRSLDKLHRSLITQHLVVLLADPGLSGDLSEDEVDRSRSDLEEEEGDDSLDEGALNLTPQGRGRAPKRHLNHTHNNINNNNNNNNILHLGKGGHPNGGLSPPSPIPNPAAGLQAALAALQAGQLSLNQVSLTLPHLRICKQARRKAR